MSSSPPQHLDSVHAALVYVAVAPFISLLLNRIYWRSTTPANPMQVRRRPAPRAVRRVLIASRATTRMAKGAPAASSPPADPTAGSELASAEADLEAAHGDAQKSPAAAPEPLTEEELDRLAGMALAEQIRGASMEKQKELMKANPRGKAWLNNPANVKELAKSREASSQERTAQRVAEAEKLRELKGHCSSKGAVPTFGASGASKGHQRSALGMDDDFPRERLEGDPAFRYDTFYGSRDAVNWRVPPTSLSPQSHAARLSPRGSASAAGSVARGHAWPWSGSRGGRAGAKV